MTLMSQETTNQLTQLRPPPKKQLWKITKNQITDTDIHMGPAPSAWSIDNCREIKFIMEKSDLEIENF
jgi:hypothetical protein